MRDRHLIPYLCALLSVPLLACGGDGSPVSGGDDLPCEAPLDLAVGDTEILDPSASGSCWLFIPSGAGDRYRVGVLWESEAATSPTTQSGTVDLTVTRREEATAAPPSTAPAPRVEAVQTPESEGGASGPVIPASVLGPALERMEATERAHARLRAFDAELAARLGSEALAPDLRDRNGDLALAPARAAAAPDTMSFEAPYESCVLDATADRIRGQLVLETEDLIVYQDSIQRESNPVDQALVQRMADYYALYGSPVIQDYFGGVSDIDGNQKVIVLVMNPPDDVGSDPAAFVLSRDLYRAYDPTTDEPICPASNEAEITYFSRSAIQAMANENYQALGTLVHEVKHISSLYNRIQAGRGLHESWIEEGTAEIAAEVSSRMAWADSGGPAVGEPMSAESISQGSGFGAAEWGTLIRIARLVRTLSEQPNALTENPTLAGDGHSYYGSSWHFHRFLGDAYHGGMLSEAAFFRRQNSPESPAGTSFLEQDFGVSMGELEEATTFATMANGTPAEASLARSFSSYGFPSAAEIFCQPNPLGVYPWTVTTSGQQERGSCTEGSDPSLEEQTPAAGFVDAVYSGSIGEGGMRIHEFVSDGTGQGIEITADVSVPQGEARVLVTRLD